ncbi:MAG: mechanosensitive ion channel domain-containing protein [Candidatus Acidiferrum sp.]
MRNIFFVRRVLRLLILGLIVASFFVVSPLLSSTGGAAQNATPSQFSTIEAPIKFWNRVIAVQRATIAGATPEDRAERASEKLAQLPLNASADEIVAQPVKVDNQDGIGFVFRGDFLFFLGTADLDKESGEKLQQASSFAMRSLAEALQARTAERSWPVIRSGLLHTLIGLVVLIALCVAAWKGQSLVIKFLRKKAGSTSLTLFRVDVLPHIAAAVYGMLRLVAWTLTLSLIYIWITLSLRRFPYTEPWGKQAGSYVLNSLRDLATTVLNGLPGLAMVALIFIVTRWIVRMANALFEQVAAGTISVTWMDADVAHATKRIFSAIVWIFAIIVAYPYIPGSHTDAFKGLSVFFGLVISLGSTGIINQIMSGLFVVYSKTLKRSEWVKVNETEGEVLEVGLLAAKIRTIEGQEVTIPNSVLVGTPTRNYTRLGHPDGMSVSSTVTIGYDVPWRQVHALLELAADRTPNISKASKPSVVQKQLSDFYVEYTLIARLQEEGLRIQTVSNLNSAIQDAFNEFGVQIMSPHYMIQPNGSVMVPREKWDAKPSPPLPRIPRKPDDPSCSDK